MGLFLLPTPTFAFDYLVLFSGTFFFFNTAYCVEKLNRYSEVLSGVAVFQRGLAFASVFRVGRGTLTQQGTGLIGLVHFRFAFAPRI